MRCLKTSLIFLVMASSRAIELFVFLVFYELSEYVDSAAAFLLSRLGGDALLSCAPPLEPLRSLERKELAPPDVLLLLSLSF